MIPQFTTAIPLLCALIVSAIAWPLLAEPHVASSVEAPVPGPRPGPVPESLRKDFSLAPFYKKHLDAQGFPILSSEKVSDYALLEAHYIIASMLETRPDVLKSLAGKKVRLAVMAPDEFTTQVPEHSDLTPSHWWDRRARGLGPTDPRPCVSCGEENLLKYEGDPYMAESILVHEFAHAIHEGLKAIDPDFDRRLRAIYEAAMEAGLWKDKYASTNREEYWAECVQSYFGDNRENDHDHNHVNTREELFEYDPEIASLVDETFKKNDWQYLVPAKRPSPSSHLKGFDPTTAPIFRWPEGSETDKPSRRPPPQKEGPPPPAGAERQ